MTYKCLPPASEGWREVMFSQVVCLSNFRGGGGGEGGDPRSGRGDPILPDGADTPIPGLGRGGGGVTPHPGLAGVPTPGRETEQLSGRRYASCVHVGLSCYWWLVRVTLVVDWWILPQNFGPVVGTYEGLLWLCECTLGGDFTSRWWGHISRICHNGSFSANGGGGSKT